jgi:hypothetical protein
MMSQKIDNENFSNPKYTYISDSMSYSKKLNWKCNFFLWEMIELKHLIVNKD